MQGIGLGQLKHVPASSRLLFVYLQVKSVWCTNQTHEPDYDNDFRQEMRSGKPFEDARIGLGRVKS